MTLPDAAGLVGVGLILAAYAGAALGRLKAESISASLMNLVGAGLILVSLAFDFNLSSVVMESAWALVAAIALVRGLLARR